MKKWEYKIVSDEVSISPFKLLELGKEGWELIAVTTDGMVVRGYLKRPLEE